MTYALKFDGVSKRYSLGLTRRSLPSVIREWIRRPLAKMKGAGKLGGEIWALRDVSFKLDHGESLALVGPNGAGKTTILKLLARITRPTAGMIEVNGSLSALIELGAGFHPDLTGRENVYLNGTILGIHRKQLSEQFDEIVGFAELERFIDTPVKRYSSGMLVRLGFATAACVRPQILLVDEVLAVGDASFRRKCVARIRELLDHGTSLVFVSHNLWLVQAVCEKAIYLDQGQIASVGPTQEVLDAYDRDLNDRRAMQTIESEPLANAVAPEVEITGINVVRLDNSHRGDLRNDEPVEIRVAYRARKDFGPANVAVRIIRNDGLTCCMMRTKVDGAEVELNRGEGMVAVTLPELQLYGGTYYVHAIVRDADDSIGVSSGTSDSFYVAGAALSHQEMNGVFEPRRKWDHLIAAEDVHEKQVAG